VTERHPEEHPDGVVIRDKRRIDPVTGQARHPEEAFDTSRPDEQDVPKAQALQLSERTEDLQRMQA